MSSPKAFFYLFIIYFFLYLFLPYHAACRILVSWPRMKPAPLALAALLTTGPQGSAIKASFSIGELIYNIVSFKCAAKWFSNFFRFNSIIDYYKTLNIISHALTTWWKMARKLNHHWDLPVYCFVKNKVNVDKIVSWV